MLLLLPVEVITYEYKHACMEQLINHQRQVIKPKLVQHSADGWIVPG